MRDIRREIVTTTLVVYLFVVASITIIPTHVSTIRSSHSDHINLIPGDYSFRCYRNAWSTNKDLKAFCVINTVGNVALFLPLGILLPLASRRFHLLKRVVLLALCLSLGIELLQFMLRFLGNPRSVDIDDVILNTLGAFCGFVFYKALIASRVIRQPE